MFEERYQVPVERIVTIVSVRRLTSLVVCRESDNWIDQRWDLDPV